MSINKEKETQLIKERYTEHMEKVNSVNEVLTYYLDPEGKEPYKLSNKKDVLIETEIQDEVLQGESGSYILYVKNNLTRNTLVNIEPFAFDKHLLFTEYPKELKPQEVGKIRLTFAPSYTRFDALNTNWGLNYSLKIK